MGYVDVLEKYKDFYPGGVPGHPQPYDFTEKFFKQQRDLFFIDVGAHNGITINNSLSLEENYGWKGICIEPNPKVFLELKKNRPTTTCVNCCVSEQDTIVNYLQIEGYSEMLSGIMEYYNEAHKQRIRNELQHYGGSTKTIQIDSLRLDTILERNGVNKVHYLSIDTEGAEMTILKSINLNKYDVELISLENNYAHEKQGFVDYLKQFGYKEEHQMGIELFFSKVK